MIVYWLGYAGCMLIYFSEDFFHRFGARGRQVRKFTRTLGHVFLIFYPITIAWVILAFSGFFQIPEWSRAPYLLFVGYVLFRLILWFTEVASGQKRILERSIETGAELAHSGAEFLGNEVIPPSEKAIRDWWQTVKGRFRNKAPKNLKRLWSKGKQFLRKRKRSV